MALLNRQLEALLKPAAEAMGCEFWGLEYLPGSRPVLRIFIDGENGVTIDDCEKVSRQASSILDVEDLIRSGYTLEVSSPGMDRPLFTKAQFEKFVGERVSVKLRFPCEGRRKFKGRLAGVENGDIVVAVDDDEYLFPVDSIDKANVIPAFTPETGGKGWKDSGA